MSLFELQFLFQLEKNTHNVIIVKFLYLKWSIVYCCRFYFLDNGTLRAKMTFDKLRPVYKIALHYVA